MNKVELIKHLFIARRIIFVDGLWGSGKSIIAPVLGSFKNVEKQKIEETYEYLCLLDYFKKASRDAVNTLLRLHADLALYNSMISREVNLRIFDDTGLLNNPGTTKYITRLFYKDGDATVDRIRKTDPILQIMTHQILPLVKPALDAFGDCLRVVEIVRHPLYMIEHWFNYIERCGKDPREFTIWIESDGEALPWFANGWEQEYKRLNTVDKVIYSLMSLIELADNTYNTLTDEQKKQIIFIPFEKFVMEPWPFIEKLEGFTGTAATPATKAVLRRQKCPRRCLTNGRGHKHYGWRKNNVAVNDQAEFIKKKDFVNSHASKKAIIVLDDLCRRYEDRHDVFKDSAWELIRDERRK